MQAKPIDMCVCVRQRHKRDQGLYMYDQRNVSEGKKMKQKGKISEGNYIYLNNISVNRSQMSVKREKRKQKRIFCLLVVFFSKGNVS